MAAPIAAVLALAATAVRADEISDAIAAAAQSYKAGELSAAKQSLDLASQLISQQNADRLIAALPKALPGWKAEGPDTSAGGGFGFENSCTQGADVDTSVWAIDVLVGAGRRSDKAVADARAFILSTQHDDGGFGFAKDKPTSADSTGLVLSAIAALGENATASPWRQPDGDDPLSALLKLQAPDGSFRFSASTSDGNVMSTTNVGFVSVSW